MKITSTATANTVATFVAVKYPVTGMRYAVPGGFPYSKRPAVAVKGTSKNRRILDFIAKRVWQAVLNLRYADSQRIIE